MYLKYPLPAHIREAILEYGEDAYGIVVKYLVETFGLSRNKAQEPAQKIIEKVLSEKEAKRVEEKVEKKKEQPQLLSKEIILGYLASNESYAKYSHDLLDLFADIYIEHKQNLKEGCDSDTLALMIYRQCLFDPNIRNIIPDSAELRAFINSIVKDLETAERYESTLPDEHVKLKRINLPLEKELFVKSLFTGAVDDEINSMVLHEVLPNTAAFQEMLLAIDYVATTILDLKKKQEKIKEYLKNLNSEITLSLLAPPLFSFDQTVESPYKNETLLKRFKQGTEALMNQAATKKVWFVRKNLFGRAVSVILVHELYKLMQDLSQKLSVRTTDKIKDIVTYNFLDIYTFAEELISGSFPKPLRELGEKIVMIGKLLRIEITNGEPKFGEKRIGTLSDREIILEIERVAQFNNNWKFLINLIRSVSPEDLRTQDFLLSLLYGLIPDNFSYNAETRKYYRLTDITEFIKELLAYKNINRYYLQAENNLTEIFEQYREKNFRIMINNELFCISGEELYKQIVKETGEFAQGIETIDMALYILTTSEVQHEESVGKEINFDELRKILSLQLQRDQGLYKQGLFYSDEKIHYISVYEFLEFLLRVILNERFREEEVELIFKNIEDMLQLPLLITIENIIPAIPFLNNNFGQFFDISMLFLVGEYIEFTHPYILNLLNTKELIDVIRNYTIYPGLGFIKVSVIGKDEHVFIPLNILAINYGMEALISTTSTVIGRMALEYGSADEWMPKIDMGKIRIKKFQLPSIIDLLKTELGITKTTSVETESYRLELRQLIQDLHDFIQNKNVIQLPENHYLCGIGDFPLHVIDIENVDSSFNLKTKTLAEYTDIVKLVVEGRHIENFPKTLEETISKYHQFIQNYPKDKVSPRLAKLFELGIEETLPAKELLRKIPETEYYEDIRSEIEKLCEITQDISIGINSHSITFYVTYSIQDLINRLWSNIIVADSGNESAWELSKDMKLIFYKEISTKIRSILCKEVAGKKLYELLFPVK